MPSQDRLSVSYAVVEDGTHLLNEVPRKSRSSTWLACMIIAAGIVLTLTMSPWTSIQLSRHRGDSAHYRTQGSSTLMSAKDVSRRSALAGASAAALLPTTHAIGAEPPRAPSNKVYISESRIFDCELPAGWQLGYDRGSTLRGPGLIATFTNPEADATFTVRRALPLSSLSSASTLEGPAIVKALAERELQTPGVTSVSVKELGARPSPRTGGIFVEYLLYTCLGGSDKGVKGAVRCIEEFRDKIPMMVRHYYVSAVSSGSYLYFGSASVPDDRWDTFAAQALNIVDSLTIDPDFS